MSKVIEILYDFPDSYFFPSTFTILLVLLITFERIKLEMPDWSHFKDLFKIFSRSFKLSPISCQFLEKQSMYRLSNIGIVMGILEDFLTIFFMVSSYFLFHPHISVRSCVLGPVCWFVHWLVCPPVGPSIREI